MKANEIPEKIYIQSFNSNEEDAIYFDAIWTEEPEPVQENIEYTRTDAFIEKATEWFRTHWRGYVGIDEDYVIHFDLWENDFKNYMKGE